MSQFISQLRSNLLTKATRSFTIFESEAKSPIKPSSINNPIRTVIHEGNATVSNIKPDGSTKRFYRNVSITEEDNGQWALRLGGYIARTREEHPLILPNRHYAMMVALEFDNQHTWIYPHTMPLTNLALMVYDRIPRERAEMTEHMVNCCSFDAACYREPPEDNPPLDKLYRKHYDPLLHWLKTEFNCPLYITTDLHPIEQPPESLAIMQSLIEAQKPWNFAILERSCFMSKSVVAGLAFLYGRANIEQVIKAARLEEDFQADQYGRIGGIYGNIVNEEYVKSSYAALRVAQNILGRDI